MIEIKSNERVTVVGKTGSGKSYLVKKLITKFDKVLFFDPKFEHGELEGNVTHNLRDTIKLMQQPKFFIIYQPQSITPEIFNCLCKQVYSRGNMVLVMDEVLRLCQYRVEEWHDRIIRMGRIRGIGLWHLTQRPTYIDGFVLSEAEHFFLFKMQLETDRKKLKGIIGNTAELTNDLKEFEFIYYNHLEDGRICPPI